ncbi:MAG: tRNA lysidine(34) synthetase TilS [bacterium]
MMEQNKHILLAVSGGADSTAMLFLFHEYLRKRFNLQLSVFHLDHGLRKKQSELDRAFVGELCRNLNLPFFSRKTSINPKKGQSLEERARHIRYGYLFQYAKKLNCHHVATAHTLEDQAETILMRIVKGCGSGGLKGIRVIRDNIIIRPLLCLTKQELTDYLVSRKQSWCTDATNQNKNFLRNRLRLTLIPYIKRNFNPKILHSLSRLAFNMQRSPSECVIKRDFGKLIEKNGEASCIEFRILKEFSPLEVKSFLEFLIKPLNPARISRKLIMSFEQFLKKPNGSQIKLPGSLTATKEYNKIAIRSSVNKKCNEKRFSFSIPSSTTVSSPNFHVSICSSVIPRKAWSGEFPAAKSEESLLDFDKLDEKIYIRYPRSQDKFLPLGMSNHQKLSDFFINNKISRWRRNKIPIILSSNEIAWIVGFRISDKFKIHEKTKNIARIRVKWQNGK